MKPTGPSAVQGEAFAEFTPKRRPRQLCHRTSSVYHYGRLSKMKRFVLISLTIGVVVSAAVLALYFLDVYAGLGEWLQGYFRSAGVYPAGGETIDPVWLSPLVIFCVGVWGTWCLADLGQAAQKVIVLVVFGILLGAASLVLAMFGVEFEPFSALSALILAACGAVFFSMGTEVGRRKQVLETVLGSRISRDKFDALMEAPQPPNFEGAVREVAVLTCHLTNREELQAALKPADFMKMANLYRRAVSHYLAQRGAYLDEAGPDMIRAYFGLLEASQDHAVYAAQVALQMKEALAGINRECHTRYLHELRIGIGLSTGPVTTGVYGSRDHFFLSGMGPAVDFSVRLAHANQRYGSDILVCPQVQQQVQPMMELRPMDLFYEQGDRSLTEVYQLLALQEDFDDEHRALRDSYWQGIIHLREGDYLAALEHLHKAQIPGREDLPLDYFILQAEEKKQAAEQPKSGLTEVGASRLLRNL